MNLNKKQKQMIKKFKKDLYELEPYEKKALSLLKSEDRYFNDFEIAYKINIPNILYNDLINLLSKNKKNIIECRCSRYSSFKFKNKEVLL